MSNDSRGTRALNILRRLMTNPHLNLGDRVYDVREREGLGWEGPSVKAWSDAVSDAREILKETGDDGDWR